MPAYNIGTTVPGSYLNCINTPLITYTTGNPCSIFDNTSTVFTATVYDADGTTILANYPLTLIGNSAATVSNITINVTGFAANSTKYQATISVTINIGAILPQGGKFSVKLEHADGVDGTFTKTQNNLFYDSNNNAATLTGVAISETLGMAVTKEISGVSYYTLGSQFTAEIGDLDYLNDRSYPLVQAEMIAPNYALPQLSIQGTNLTFWTNAYNNTNAGYLNTSWTISTANVSYVGSAGKASARVIDWTAGAYVDSPSSFIAVDTYQDNATRIFEDFRNESKRLKTDWTVWDSSQKLDTYDGNQGLQYSESKLIYPQTNYTVYNPNPGSQPDYSSLSGDRIAYIKFYKINQSFSNGRFVLGAHNITEADLTSGDVKFEVSLDNVDYYNINALYVGGALSGGDPCRINDDVHGLVGATVNDSSLEFTFGTGKFTAASTGAGPENWGAVLKVTFKSTPTGKSKSIGSINMVTWA